MEGSLKNNENKHEVKWKQLNILFVCMYVCACMYHGIITYSFHNDY